MLQAGGCVGITLAGRVNLVLVFNVPLASAGVGLALLSRDFLPRLAAGHAVQGGDTPQLFSLCI